MATNIIYKGELNGTQVDFSTGSLTDISTFDTDVRSSAIQNQIVDGVTDRGASQDAIYAMSGYLAANAHPDVTPASNISIDNSSGTVLQDASFTFDADGHVTAASFVSKNLNDIYYTETEVNTLTGALSTRIDGNDTDISNLQTATGNLNGRINSNDTELSNLATATGDLDSRLTTAESDISTLETSTGTLRADIDSNDNELTTLRTATGYLENQIDDLQAVSGVSNLDAVTDAGATTANDIQVGDIRVDGGNITGPATITIDPDSAGAAGTVVIQGDLQVEGTTTTISSTDVQVGDKSMILGTGAANDAAMDGGGMILSGTAGTVAEFTYDGTNDRWKTNNLDIEADIVGTATGADAWTTPRSLSLTTDVSGSATIDGSSNITIAANIASDAITSAEIADDAVGTEHIINNAVTNAKLANTSVSITGGAGLAGGGNATLGGSAVSLSISAGNGLTANTDSLDIDLDGSTLSKSSNGLKVGTITSDEIAADAIYGTKIADDAIDSEHITNGSIDNVHLAGSIATSKLVSDTIQLGGVTVSLGGNNMTPPFNLVDATGYNASELIGPIDHDQIAPNIPNDSLEYDSVSFGGVSLDLGQSDATPAFNLTDATNYPTTALVGTITNDQLAGSIANGKLVNDSITVTASNGLSGGGTPALGGSTSLSTSSDQSHLDEIELGTDNSAETNVVTKGGILILRGTDNNGITTDGTDANAIDLNNKTTVAFEGVVQSARTDQDSDNGSYVAMWKIQGVIRRDADSTNMLQSFVTKTFAGANASAYGLSVSVSGNGLKINSDQNTANLITSATINYNWIEDIS